MAVHFVWELYLALAAEGGRTEAEGRAEIKRLLPKTYAQDVDNIVAVAGDLSKLDPAVRERHIERMREEAQAIESGGVNDSIREARGATRRLFTDDDEAINKTLRERRGRLMATSGSER